MKVWWCAAAVTAPAAALALFLLFWPTLTNDSIRFWIGDPENPGHEGMSLRAETGQPLLVRFEDGSRVELAAGSSGTIGEASDGRVSLALLSGGFDAQLRPETKLTWHFITGPYRLEVLGTSFSVQWQSTEEYLRLEVTRGAVRVGDRASKPGGNHQGWCNF